MGNIGGIIFIAILVLGIVYVYNAFVAEKGKSIADLGKKAA